MNELKCPGCGWEFILDDDYLVGDCENCHGATYHWDYVLDGETYEEILSGYDWELIPIDVIRERKLGELGI
jgi:hypothetical protein